MQSFGCCPPARFLKDCVCLLFLNPLVLLCWCGPAVPSGLYVISAVTKNVIGPPDFRLTNLIKDDAWVRLKRGNQDGLAFTPVRKVLTLED